MQVMISAFQPHGEVSGQIPDISIPKDKKKRMDIYSIICDGLGGNSAGILFGLKARTDQMFHTGFNAFKK
ncbi:MAG: hypothetical protein U1E88_07670 [Acinetobacter sp.]